MWTAWCARCHAEDGSGRINEPTITVEPMDFTDCKVTSPEPDVDWERAIARGGPGVGLSPQMPAFEDSLTADQIATFGWLECASVGAALGLVTVASK